MRALSLLAAAVAVLAVACVPTERLLIGPIYPPFDSVAQIDASFTLTLFGGGGNWTVNEQVTLHNRTSQPHSLEYEVPCNPRLQVYANPQGTGEAAWDEALEPSNRCPPQRKSVVLVAGDSIVLVGRSTNTIEILNHYGLTPNPAGTYYFFATFTPVGVPGGAIRRLVGFANLSLQ